MNAEDKQEIKGIVDDLEQLKDRLLKVSHKYDESTDEGKYEADTMERCYFDMCVAVDDLQYLIERD